MNFDEVLYIFKITKTRSLVLIGVMCSKDADFWLHCDS